jgi:hypothetical protein
MVVNLAAMTVFLDWQEAYQAGALVCGGKGR